MFYCMQSFRWHPAAPVRSMRPYWMLCQTAVELGLVNVLIELISADDGWFFKGTRCLRWSV
jgi:hypothetical protein